MYESVFLFKYEQKYSISSGKDSLIDLARHQIKTAAAVSCRLASLAVLLLKVLIKVIVRVPAVNINLIICKGQAIWCVQCVSRQKLTRQSWLDKLRCLIPLFYLFARYLTSFPVTSFPVTLSYLQCWLTLSSPRPVPPFPVLLLFCLQVR